MPGERRAVAKADRCLCGSKSEACVVFKRHAVGA